MCRSETPPSIRKHQKKDQRFSESSFVESLKDGVDYTGSIYPMKFDMVVNAVYPAVTTSAVSALLDDAGIDTLIIKQVEQRVYLVSTTVSV